MRLPTIHPTISPTRDNGYCDPNIETLMIYIIDIWVVTHMIMLLHVSTIIVYNITNGGLPFKMFGYV